jgi:LCP family protein required for cell wall assembly
MKKNTVALILILALVAVSCTLISQISSPRTKLAGDGDYLLVAPPGSTPTATPFQPLAPTPSNLVPEQAGGGALEIGETPEPEVQFTADVHQAWEDYPGPSVWPDIDVPSPMGILSHPKGQVNILLLGSDQRPNDGGFRTDTIQLLTINPRESTVKLTSFPRDLYVYIPGYTVQRINTAFGWGGFESLAQTMEYNFGVKPEFYVLINFWSFVDVIDSIGGISVEIGQDLCDHRDGYENYCVAQGTMWMDGDTALWYVRSRYSSSDIDRGRRQQEVLEAVFNQMVSLNGLSRAPELYNIYKQNVTTNLSFDDLTGFLMIASDLVSSHQIGNFSIGDEEAYDWTTTNGAMVLVPIRDLVLEVMRQVISEP